MARKTAMVLAVLLALSVSALAGDRPLKGSRAEDAGTLIIALDRNYPPFSVLGPRGEPTGFLVEMWRLWSKATGTRIRFRPSSWAETISALRRGEADIHFGLYKTEERARWMAFSSPVYEVKTAIYARAAREKTSLSLDKLKGQRVGAVKGTYQEQYLKQRYPGIQTVGYVDTEKMVAAILKREIQALVDEVPITEANLSRLGLRGALIRSDKILFSNSVHAGVLKGNRELLERINDGLKKIPPKKLYELEHRWLPYSGDRYYSKLQRGLRLSREEKSWLEAHPKIRVGIMNAWPPMDFVDENRAPQGIRVESEVNRGSTFWFELPVS